MPRLIGQPSLFFLDFLEVYASIWLFLLKPTILCRSCPINFVTACIETSDENRLFINCILDTKGISLLKKKFDFDLSK
jgi:hypothetical protein